MALLEKSVTRYSHSHPKSVLIVWNIFKCYPVENCAFVVLLYQLRTKDTTYVCPREGDEICIPRKTDFNCT